MLRKGSLRAILVPLDGSPFAERALPLALELAQRSGAKLRLALVHHGAVPPVSVDALELYAAVERTVLKSERGYLRGVAARLGKALGRPVRSAFLSGPVGPALVSHASQVRADLVVMSTHGRGPFGRLWLGSVADRLLRTLDVPTLLTRPVKDSGVTASAASVIGQILVPLDGSALAECALEPAAKVASLLGIDLLLIQVVVPPVIATDPPLPYPTGVEEKLARIRLHQAQDYLNDMVDKLRGQGQAVTGVAVTAPDVPGTILQLGRPPRIGLLAIATHGRGGLSRLFLGSVTDKLVRGADVPVLVCRSSRLRPRRSGKRLARKVREPRSARA